MIFGRGVMNFEPDGYAATAPTLTGVVLVKLGCGVVPPPPPPPPPPPLVAATTAVRSDVLRLESSPSSACSVTRIMKPTSALVSV